MKEFLFQKHKRLIIGGFVVIFLVLFFILSLNSGPQNSPTATPSKFYLVSRDPATNQIESMWSVVPIMFTYSLPVDPLNIQYVVQPSIDLKISPNAANPKQFSLIPLNGWDQNKEYTITIIKVKATTGETTSPFSFTFKRIFDPNSIQDLPDEQEHAGNQFIEPF